MLRLVPSLLLLAGPPLAAQTSLVLPARLATSEAESFTGFPFGRGTPVRVQHYYAPSLFTGALTIRELAFRPDGSQAFVAKSLEVEIALSTGPARVEAVQARFADNRGADHRVSFQRRTVDLPAIAAAAGPRAFDVAFTLDQSFAFDPARGGLVVEVFVAGQPPGRYDLDLGTGCTSAQASFGKPGCPGSNARVPLADCPTQALLWGQPFVLRARNLLPRAPALLPIGTMESGFWNGLPIPFALDGLRAPGCSLNVDMALIVAGAADAMGELRLVGQLPADARLLGFWLRFQALALDAAANPLGLTTSNGSRTQVCGPDPVARVVATTATAVLGQVEAGVVPVTRLR